MQKIKGVLDLFVNADVDADQDVDVNLDVDVKFLFNSPDFRIQDLFTTRKQFNNNNKVKQTTKYKCNKNLSFIYCTIKMRKAKHQLFYHFF